MTSTVNLSWLTNLYRQRTVQWFTALYLLAVGAIFVIGAAGMPVQLAGDSPLANAMLFLVGMLVYLLHIAIIYLVV